MTAPDCPAVTDELYCVIVARRIVAGLPVLPRTHPDVIAAAQDPYRSFEAVHNTDMSPCRGYRTGCRVSGSPKVTTRSPAFTTVSRLGLGNSSPAARRISSAVAEPHT